LPALTIRSASEVPPPRRSPKAILEAQLEYERYINAIGGDVGELELEAGEQPRGIKVRLRRAATRLGKDIETWDSDGRVYFRQVAKRGRPRKNSV
jgi:hypothetical protein